VFVVPEAARPSSPFAQQLWGDSSFWYLIADANGLDGSETPAAGRVIVQVAISLRM